jgi:hypothetical protein
MIFSLVRGGDERKAIPKAYKDKRGEITLGVPFLGVIEMTQDALFLWI